MGGPYAVLSARLRHEFYGLPETKTCSYKDCFKEAVHELGHTSDLTHCDDYSSVTAPSDAVEWIDLKESALCSVRGNEVFNTAGR
jgi:predicted Zn-dependent protease